MKPFTWMYLLSLVSLCALADGDSSARIQISVLIGPTGAPPIQTFTRCEPQHYLDNLCNQPLVEYSVEQAGLGQSSYQVTIYSI